MVDPLCLANVRKVDLASDEQHQGGVAIGLPQGGKRVEGPGPVVSRHTPTLPEAIA